MNLLMHLDETPQETKGYEGFYHVHHLSGSIEETV
jgi:tripeptide aminopeptidase